MQVIISTPSKQEIINDFKSIKLNSEAGECIILPHHENFIALVMGDIIIEAGDKTLKFNVAEHTLFQFENSKSTAKIFTSFFNSIKYQRNL